MRVGSNEIVEFIESLKGYKGYIQYSNRIINKKEDIFINSNPKVNLKDGFIYEAHFANEKGGIAIRQINDEYFISKTDLSNIDKDDIDIFESDIKDFNYKIKMAQIWQESEDEFCEGLKRNVLKAVVFAGFLKDEK